MCLDVRTYWLEPTDQAAVAVRRWARTSKPCPGPLGYHDAGVHIGLEPVRWIDTGWGRRTFHHRRAPERDDRRWPVRCAHCDYLFAAGDGRNTGHTLIYRRADTGDLVVLTRHHDAGTPAAPAPTGATWDAWWMADDDGRGPDGIHLMCRLPGGRDWHVDGRASNCTRPDDRAHRCWVRHGDPRQADVTVDKDGDTCAAGAGSIRAGHYHGFLRAGLLVPA